VIAHESLTILKLTSCSESVQVRTDARPIPLMPEVDRHEDCDGDVDQFARFDVVERIA